MTETLSDREKLMRIRNLINELNGYQLQYPTKRVNEIISEIKRLSVPADREPSDWDHMPTSAVVAG